jgi:hypothetical protein
LKCLSVFESLTSGGVTFDGPPSTALARLGMDTPGIGYLCQYDVLYRSGVEIGSKPVIKKEGTEAPIIRNSSVLSEKMKGMCSD